MFLNQALDFISHHPSSGLRQADDAIPLHPAVTGEHFLLLHALLKDPNSYMVAEPGILQQKVSFTKLHKQEGTQVF